MQSSVYPSECREAACALVCFALWGDRRNGPTSVSAPGPCTIASKVRPSHLALLAGEIVRFEHSILPLENFSSLLLANVPFFDT